MNQYETVRPLLVERVIPAYGRLGRIAFVYAQGSLVEGLATQADLDLVVVWDEEPPPVPARAGLGLAEPAPKPEWFHQRGFILDRFWMAGQQIDTKHVPIAEVRDWVGQVEAGGGTSGYPMPVIAVAGLLAGEVLVDERSEARALRARLQTVPAALVTHTSAVFAPEALDLFLEQLEACVARGDGLLFYSMATDLMGKAYIAWFARQGRYWPHEKRLQTRLVHLGRADLAEGDAAIWSAALPEAFSALREQLDRLRADQAWPGSTD